jgi:cytoskeletal protein CcmA (bactofilin family)
MQTPTTQGNAGQPDLSGPANDSDPQVAADRKPLSVIGADIVVTGNIEASVDLHLEGKVVGDVRCATLILGESSTVTGRVYATRVKISGVVEGAIDTKDLAVEATARVSGEISYERLRVSNGGVMEGNVTRKVAAGGGDDGARLKLVESAKKSKRDPEE